jgi:hypothetical protein
MAAAMSWLLSDSAVPCSMSRPSTRKLSARVSAIGGSENTVEVRLSASPRMCRPTLTDGDTVSITRTARRSM